ncbi:MAG TPA: nuclear transport factor 2 family protein, partial [Anaerolineae bacterium]|nr:nuclear transport factor 2 family protein [Anaerolineae bacterium]
MTYQQPTTNPQPALTLINQYVADLATGNLTALAPLRHPDFILDWVYADAFADSPLPPADADAFWNAWLTAFPQRDYHVTRTVAADTVVVTEWTFSGTNTGSLG